VHHDHPKHESASDVHKVEVDEACRRLASIFIINYLAVVHGLPTLLKILIPQSVQILVAPESLKKRKNY